MTIRNVLLAAAIGLSGMTMSGCVGAGYGVPGPVVDGRGPVVGGRYAGRGPRLQERDNYARFGRYCRRNPAYRGC